MLARQLFTDMQDASCIVGECSYFTEQGDEFNSDIVDLDWISSSGNSCEDEGYDRYFLLSFPTLGNLRIKQHQPMSLQPLSSDCHLTLLCLNDG